MESVARRSAERELARGVREACTRRDGGLRAGHFVR